MQSPCGQEPPIKPVFEGLLDREVRGQSLSYGSRVKEGHKEILWFYNSLYIRDFGGWLTYFTGLSVVGNFVIRCNIYPELGFHIV